MSHRQDIGEKLSPNDIVRHSYDTVRNSLEAVRVSVTSKGVYPNSVRTDDPDMLSSITKEYGAFSQNSLNTNN